MGPVKYHFICHGAFLPFFIFEGSAFTGCNIYCIYNFMISGLIGTFVLEIAVTGPVPFKWCDPKTDITFFPSRFGYRALIDLGAHMTARERRIWTCIGMVYGRQHNL